ncbi:MAG: caspase family protein [Flavobacterium sp. JAD_PAG50586_2]|nr:MAG: caspase family protein [Flavobacterium sp. JAD_PAG50586_2]
MTKGISIHIGLNSIDPNHYGTNGQLRGCENDAKDMEKLAVKNGFSPKVLLTGEATSQRVLSELIIAARELQPGDILFLTYSGHGSQLKDNTGDEEDGYDETWCLFDRMLLDDELYNVFSKFAMGVRVIMLSDSCHSGTVAREVLINGKKVLVYEESNVYRCLDPGLAEQVNQNFSYLYTGIKYGIPRGIKNEIGAGVLLLSGCQDNQLSQDGMKNGVFTENLLSVWKNGTFRGNYKKLFTEISRKMPLSQSPNYYYVGTPNPSFESQQAFSIENYKEIDNGREIVAESNRNITWTVDIDEKIWCKLNDTEMRNYLKNMVIDPMVDGYQNFRTLSNQIIFTTRGGEISGGISCDSHGCDVHVGGSIRF